MKSISKILRTRNDIFKQHHKLIIRLSSTSIEERIEIPNRIPRGPTDILRALESTIQRDPTAPHYKYHDDPYLIPMSNMGKRTFAMAQESGRKAAYWVRQQHADLFQHQEADPPIKAFAPKTVYNENSNVTEEDLKTVINDVIISDAITVYNLCKAKGIEISSGTLQSLLELLCYYNSQDTLQEEFIEERWFKQSAKGKEKVRKTWKDGSLAEEIFIGIENPGSKAYSALIQGMAKYYQAERAMQLFEEAQKKDIAFNAEVYNSIISVSNFLRDTYERRWTFITDTLSLMEKAKVKANLRTLNAVLECLSIMGISKTTKNSALSTLAEFKKLGVEPSLASWYYILITFCKERGPTSTILNDIMQYIENKEHAIKDVKDTYFFVTAMDICRNHLFDKDLAQRVHKLLHYGNNYDLIGDSYKESIYYRHYFLLMCASEPLEEFMKNVYFKLVPHIYVPEPSVISEILKTIDVNGAVEYIPQIWSDMIVFDHTSRENLLELILTAMVNNPPEATSDLIQKFGNIAWDVCTKVDYHNENRLTKISFTGELLGNIMTILLRSNDFDSACKIMGKLDTGHHTVLGVPKLEALSLFLDHCIEQKLPSKAITCIQYCNDSGFHEAEKMAVKLNKALTLDETHLSRLSKIVGSFVLDQSLNAKENEV